MDIDELRRLLAQCFNDTDELEKRLFFEALLDYLQSQLEEDQED